MKYVLIFLMLIGTAFCQTTVSSPDSSSIVSLAIFKGDIYCVTRKIENTIIDPFNKLYLFKSSDDGTSWTKDTLNLIGLSNIKLAATDSSLFILNGQGASVFSTQNDSSWTRVNLPTVDQILNILTNGNSIFLGFTYLGTTNYAGLISFDNGTTWKLDTLFGGQLSHSPNYINVSQVAMLSNGIYLYSDNYPAVNSNSYPGLYFSDSLQISSMSNSYKELLDSLITYYGVTGYLTSIEKLVNINDTLYMFWNVGQSSFNKRSKYISSTNTVIWQITNPDSIGTPVDTSRFPANFTATTSATVKDTIPKSYNSVSSLPTNNIVVFGTSNGNVVTERQEIISSTISKIHTPTVFRLNQNYPNPFNPTTTVTYSLEQSTSVNISVYNILGEKIETVVNNYQTIGNHRIMFDGSKFSSGVYFLVLTTNHFSKSIKMLLLK